MLTRIDLEFAVASGIIPRPQLDVMWPMANRRRRTDMGLARFSGLVAIGVWSLFLPLAVERIVSSPLPATAMSTPAPAPQPRVSGCRAD